MIIVSDIESWKEIAETEPSESSEEEINSVNSDGLMKEVNVNNDEI